MDRKTILTEFPTGVGINRNYGLAISSVRRVPHGRGDKPTQAMLALGLGLSSPRAWG